MGVVRLLLVSPMTVRNLTNDCAVSAMIVFDKDRKRNVTGTAFLNVSKTSVK